MRIRSTIGEVTHFLPIRLPNHMRARTHRFPNTELHRCFFIHCPVLPRTRSARVGSACITGHSDIALTAATTTAATTAAKAQTIQHTLQAIAARRARGALIGALCFVLAVGPAAAGDELAGVGRRGMKRVGGRSGHNGKGHRQPGRPSWDRQHGDDHQIRQ